MNTCQQPAPVCPHCGDRDDDDAHKVISEKGASMMVQCICGKTYLAEAEKSPSGRRGPTPKPPSARLGRADLTGSPMQPQNQESHSAARARFAHARAEQRQKLLGKAHIARKQMGWSDEEWEAIKLSQGGADSLKEMGIEQIEAIIHYAEASGWKPVHKKADGNTSRPLSTKAQAKKLRALWLDMHGHGMVRDADETALRSWLSNSRSPNVTTNPDLMDFQQLDASIERLKQWRKRLVMEAGMECPICKKPFKPSPKQAAAFGRLACDKHRNPVAYQLAKPNGLCHMPRLQR
jgi:phage gp16-like protein